jgi:hypothetical protein
MPTPYFQIVDSSSLVCIVHANGHERGRQTGPPAAVVGVQISETCWLGFDGIGRVIVLFLGDNSHT